MSSVTDAEPRAKSRTKCAICFKYIEKGDHVRVYRRLRDGRTRWCHANCYVAPDQLPDDGPADLTDDANEKIGRLVQRIEQLEAKLEEKLEAGGGGQVRTIEIRRPDAEPIKLEGTVHPVFDKVLKLAQARKHIFLPGPAGCGKSHLAQQLAEALGLKFGFISCSAGMSESQLLGRMVPAGKQGQFVFLGTQFLDCYENGGVFLFDELDAADSNVLLVINSALANGHLSVPSRHDNPVAKKHPDFVCIAAANTYGRGADRQYVGRNELDESTLDRFRIGTVPMDYDESLERQLCPDDELYVRLRGYRDRVQENRLERLVSTRFIREAYEMTSQWGWTYAEVDAQLFAGWREDEVAKVRA